MTDTDLAAVDRARVDRARRDHPEHTWLLEEPVERPPVIDADGHAWVFGWDGDDPDDRDDPAAWSWLRQAMTIMGRGDHLIGPPLCQEWDDVLSYGPIRLAIPDDDLSIAYLWYPQGWRNGSSIGEPQRLRTPRIPVDPSTLNLDGTPKEP